jgi:hypothetical protein
MKNQSVYGIYQTQVQLENGLDQLKARGFRDEDVSILLPGNLGNKDLSTEKNSKMPEGAAAGGTSGAVVGGALGWLAGIGALAIPGLGPFIAAGPIMAALAGVGAGAAVGGLVGGLAGMGVPEYEAKRYEGRVKDGGILISVHCDSGDWVDKAKNILEVTGARDISSSSEWSADYAESDRPVPRGVAS